MTERDFWQDEDNWRSSGYLNAFHDRSRVVIGSRGLDRALVDLRRPAEQNRAVLRDRERNLTVATRRRYKHMAAIRKQKRAAERAANRWR